ncbi:MAG: SEC-C domain-containing protein [Bacillota bacterium]
MGNILRRPIILRRSTGIESPRIKPCPCGSGRDYYDCCAGKVVTLDQVRWRIAARELKRKLGSFAQQPAFNEAAIWAQHLYLSGMAGSLFSLDDDFVSERCFEWFIFDFPVSGTKTIVELYRKAAVSDLNKKEITLLGWWESASNAFYEVKALGDQSIFVEDILSGETFHVRGFENPSDVALGSILYLRLLRVGEEFEFSTTGLSLPQESKETLLSWLKKDYKAFKRLVGKKKADWNSYFRQRAHRITALATTLGSAGQNTSVKADDVWGERLNNLIYLLEEHILREIIRSQVRRERWREFFGKVVKESKEDSEPGENGVKRKRKLGPEGFAWPHPEHAEVARLVAQDLKKRGKIKQVGEALKLWYKFCTLNEPAVRKAAAWVAAVVYMVARLEGNRAVKQERLATEYGVSASAVSVKYRLLCRSLGIF